MKKLLMLMMCVFALSLSGCNGNTGSTGAGSGGSSGGSRPNLNASKGSCDITYGGAHYCIDATGSGWQDNSLESVCDNLPGTTHCSTIGCPESQYGICVTGAGEEVEQVYNFYDGYTSASAQSLCASMEGQYYGK